MENWFLEPLQKTRQTVTEFGLGEFPDGIIFDDENHLWVTCIISNRLIRVAPNGNKEILLEDCDLVNMNAVEKKYQLGQLESDDFTKVRPKILRNISCTAFGGDDLRTVWLGSLQGCSLASFRSPIKGIKPVHWKVYPKWVDKLIL